MPDLTKDAVLALADFQDECARYFATRDTGGEDRAHWANVFNAENARKSAEALRTAAPLLDVTGEEELREALAEALWRAEASGTGAGANARAKEQWSEQSESTHARWHRYADALLPMIAARIAQARAEGRDLLRRAVNGEVEICAGGMPLPPEGPCDCGAEDDEPCRAIHDHTEETTND